MTQQLSLEGFSALGRIVPTDLQGEMQRSYLEYAMSVIVGRALPDVRDGLKPVHRRILYAMHELGLTPDRPYRKCARVVGDVLGKYHPHGDQAVYDALVRMVQDFSSRYPLADGHGNFGSIDNDPPAAMRYTECRLSGMGNSGLLNDISETIVDFMPNFDGSQAEPTVLPARLPILLLNGSSGIAVGMATNIPPHNLGEVVDALLALIERPHLSSSDLMQWIPAPDFPTGGQILSDHGIRDAYSEGRGLITVRGVTQFEEIQPGKGRHRRSAIIVTEFPFQVNKAAWIEKVAELVNDNRLSGIADLRDESDRTGIRVVIELRKDAHPQQVLQQLFKLTSLQTTFGAILLALVNNEPQQLSLKALLQYYLDFREATLLKLFRSEQEQVSRKVEEVAGMLLALADLDRVIQVLRQSADGTTAKRQLQEQLACTERQADTILAMPLRRLLGLEQQRLHEEHQTLLARLTELQGLLEDRSKLLNYLKKDLRALKKAHGDPRRSQVKSAQDLAAEIADLPDPQDSGDAPVVVQLTRKGYIRRLAVGGRRSRATGSPRDTGGDDPIRQIFSARLQQEILVLTASGRAFNLAVEDIPHSTGQAKGIPLVTLLPVAEPVIELFLIDSQDPQTAQVDVLLLSQQGRLKRVEMAELMGLTARGTTALKLKDDDTLGWATLTPSGDPQGHTLLIATSGGRLLRLSLAPDHLPVMGRIALGQAALRLHKRESIVGMCRVSPQGSVILASRAGYFKRLAVQDVPIVERGAIGVQAMQFKQRNDSLVGLLAVVEAGEVDVLLESGQIIVLPLSRIPLQAKSQGGELLMQTNTAISSLHLFHPQGLTASDILS
ncbi:MAG: DNA topoisomerase (ATP-hydrolyzing) [Cyanobacteriota bacterium]|nr:DNA topoisomerase (ATP-hydrolyzing) [Cyanobacteriota bacterium]